MTGRWRSRPLLAVVVLATAALTGGASPVGAGEPPAETPVVHVVRARSMTSMGYRDCEGVDHLGRSSGEVLLERSGDLLSELRVPLEIDERVASNLDPLPSEAVFPAGEITTFVHLAMPAPVEGTLTLTLVDGPEHDVGDPGAVEVTVEPPVMLSDCSDPLPVAPELLDQTIGVGAVPRPLGLDWVRASRVSRDGPPPEELYFTMVLSGSLPAGLTYEDDTWGGAATTPGESRFRVAACSTYLPFFGEVKCLGTADVRIVVVEQGVGDPTVAPSPAAAPVSAAAALTG